VDDWKSGHHWHIRAGDRSQVQVKVHTHMSENRRMLSGPSIAELDGMVIIEFTKLLVEEVEDDDNEIIYLARSDEFDERPINLKLKKGRGIMSKLRNK
jgi:hypothetical protein